MDIVKEIKSEDGKRLLRIYVEEDPVNPREFDNIGTMICWHRDYDFGDKNESRTYIANGYARKDGIVDYICDSFYDKIKERFPDIGERDDEYRVKKTVEWMVDNIYLKILYIYDHSGLMISTSKFSCQWDSGMVGFIYIHKDDIIEYAKYEGIEHSNYAWSVVEEEVQEYDDYLQGNVYKYDLIEVIPVITTKTNKLTGELILEEDCYDENIVDSCGGYYGKQGLEYIYEEHKKWLNGIEDSEEQPKGEEDESEDIRHRESE